MISVGIIGGSGYTGKYIVKFCTQHPKVSNFEIYANKSASKKISEVFPELINEIEDKTIKSVENLDLTHDVYFFALPHGESQKYIPSLSKLDKKLIDLGADFRLDDSNLFKTTYKDEHAEPALLNLKNYGLTDIYNDYKYNLVANPGCYPTAALLSAIPVVKFHANKILNVSTIAYSGISGAGKKVSQDLLFSENYNSVKAYNVGTHRHEVEIEQELNKFGENLNYSLTTHLLPLYSGIYSTTVISTASNIEQKILDEQFNNLYANSEFVRLRKTPPELKWVIGTNYCDINVTSVKNKIIVTAALDNLVKGAAGQAIENMNKLFGWKESLGIKFYKEEKQNV